MTTDYGYILFSEQAKYCWRRLTNDTVQQVTVLALFKINRTEKCFRQMMTLKSKQDFKNFFFFEYAYKRFVVPYSAYHI